MARKVLVRLVDDLDGLPSEDVSTVTFALDRVEYQIDLSEANANKLRDTLSTFVSAARRTGGRIKRGVGSRTAESRSGNASEVREWARSKGHDLADRGRIPAHIVAEFEAAKSAAKAPAAKPAARRSAAAKAAPKTATAKTAPKAAAKAKPAATAKAAVKPAAKTTTAKTTTAKAAPKAAAKTTKAAAAKKATPAKTTSTRRSTKSR